MHLFRSFVSALSMFTAIPMPQYEWDMEHGSRMTACFGIVGAVLGALWLGFAWILSLLPLPAAVAAVLFVAAAQLSTGFLHLDGFMDVCDALLSHRDEEGRRSILKDPHCGSFAVISLVLVLAAQLAAVHALRGGFDPARAAAVLIGVPALSRAAAGLLLLTVRAMPGSSLGAYFKTGNGPAVRLVLVFTGIAAAIAVCILSGWAAAAALLCALTIGALAGRYAAHRLGGVNGDIAGFTVVLCETLMLLALTLLI